MYGSLVESFFLYLYDMAWQLITPFALVCIKALANRLHFAAADRNVVIEMLKIKFTLDFKMDA